MAGDQLSPLAAKSDLDVLVLARGIGGAVLGALAGFAVFTALAKFGLYALVIPGALVGIVGSYFSQRRSLILGIICIAVAAILTIFTEWWNFPFAKDTSLIFFLEHLGNLNLHFWLSLLLGCGVAFWFGLGNDRTEARTAP